MLWFIHMIYIFFFFFDICIYMQYFFWFIHWKVSIGGSLNANIIQLDALPMRLEDLILSKSGVNSIPRHGTAGIGCCSGSYPRLLFPNVHLTSQVKTLASSYNVMNIILAALSIRPESWSLTDGHIYLVWLNLSHAYIQAVWHLTNNWASSKWFIF